VFDLGNILRKMRQTAIYVTHDQEEAFALADRVVVMNAGRVEQVDTPQAIYLQPASAFVARFLGLANLLPGRAEATKSGLVVDTAIGRLPLDGQAPYQDEVTVLLRPDAVQLNGKDIYQLEGFLVEKSFRGSTCRAVVAVNGIPLVFEFPSNDPLPRQGEKVRLSFNPHEAIQVFRK
jgi:ABC-type Fe3+/spermidine/putrescine transport system ATPase subunit